MKTYVAFLRGINVGGKGLIKMAELKDCLTQAGLTNVRTYIQSGNVIFKSESGDQIQLALTISAAIDTSFGLDVAAAVFSDDEWRHVIESAPDWWGNHDDWKHNMLIMTEPDSIPEALTQIGELKPDIESIMAGERVLYQSVSWQYFGRARSGKLASLPIYKKMTIRNFNTATKIVALLT